MSFFFNALKSTFYSLALGFIVLVSLLIFLLTTTAGLYITVKAANIFLNGKLRVEQLEGRLIDNVSFGHLSYQEKGLAVELSDFHLKWKINAIFHHQIVIERLRANLVKLDFSSAQTVKSATKSEFSLPKLPFELAIQDLEINQLQISQDRRPYQFEQLKLQGELDQAQWQLSQFNTIFANTFINLDGQGQSQAPYSLNATLQVKPINKKGQRVEGLFNLGGDQTLYHWHGELSQPTQLKLNGTLTNLNEVHSLLDWKKLRWNLDKKTTLESPEGQLRIDGKLADLALELTTTTITPLQANWLLKARTTPQGVITTGLIQLPEATIDLDLTYNNNDSPLFSGKVHAQSLAQTSPDFPFKSLQFFSQFKGDSLTNLTGSTDFQATYFNSPLTATLRYEQQYLKGNLKLGNNQLQFSGSPPYQWQANATIPEPHLLHPALAGLSTVIAAQATISKANKGELTLTIQPGHFQSPEDENPVKMLAFKGGKFQANLNPQGLVARGNLTIDPSKQLVLALTLPQFQLDKGLKAQQSIQGNLRLEVNSLRFLQNLSTAIAKVDGKLLAVLKTTGTIGQPVVTGNIHLNKAKISLPKLGLNLNPIQLTIKSKNKSWEAQGSLVSKGTPLLIQGKGKFSPTLTGSINLDSKNFPLIDSEEYSINLSPQLTILFKPKSLEVKGRIVIPKAQLKPQSFDNSVSLTDDVVFVGQKPPENPLHINADVQLIMGDEVAIDVKGLHGFLTGAINLRQLPQGPLNASGELNVRDGKYQAYGQDLNIEEGQLLFTGGLIDNPGIQVRAVRQFKNATSSFEGSNRLFDFNSANAQTIDFGNKTTVGIEVSGRIKAPKIHLFSNPASLSQADILSMLLLGRPASQANQAGGQLLLAAISSMNLGSGTGGLQLLEQLKQKLGFDLNFQTNSKYNQQTNQISENNAVVVGKSISKRLYASYNVGLSQADTNVFTLTYLLNKFFSIQVNASVNASGIDLLYTHQKE